MSVFKKPTIKELKTLPPSEVEKLPIPLRIELPPTSRWDAIKAFFVYSETIFLARTEAVVGVVVMAVGSMDWAPLLGINFDTGFSRNQVFWLGGLSFVKGIFTELARRRNLKDGL